MMNYKRDEANGVPSDLYKAIYISETYGLIEGSVCR